jgi:gamma-glutamylaminecyclotransferase
LRIEDKKKKKILEREREHMHIRTENNSNHASMTTLLFTHRTLKRGFSNHVLMQDLIKTRDAVFNGIYRNEQGSLRRGCRV